jgi:hypothetical protein
VNLPSYPNGTCLVLRWYVRGCRLDGVVDTPGRLVRPWARRGLLSCSWLTVGMTVGRWWSRATTRSAWTRPCESLLDCGRTQQMHSRAGRPEMSGRQQRLISPGHPCIPVVPRIRPGRIDKMIKLDFVQANEAIQMAEHFLGPMTDEQKASLHRPPPPEGEKLLLFS